MADEKTVEVTKEVTEDKSKELTPNSSVVIHQTTQHTETNNWDKPFWRSVFSTEYGTGSTSRISSMIVILVSLGLVSYLVIKNNIIPADLLEFGWFASLLITVVYSPSKIAEIFKTISKTPKK
jgi:hypothetical protein